MPTLKRLPMLKNIKLICYTVLIAFSFLYCSKDSSGNFAGGAPSGQGGSLARFAIVNDYLYAVDDENLNVFSISNPANPQLLRTIKVGFEIETIFPFKDKLFIGSTSVVHIFSIADPSKPAKLSQAISPTVLRRCDPVVAPAAPVACSTRQRRGLTRSQPGPRTAPATPPRPPSGSVTRPASSPARQARPRSAMSRTSTRSPVTRTP